MIEPTVEHIKLTCPSCGSVSYINWNDVAVCDLDFSDSPLRNRYHDYGDFLCPVCKSLHGVYTKDPIELIRRKEGSPY